jgi:hypothetical protein
MPNAKLCRLVILIVLAGCTTQPGKDHIAAAGADVRCRSEQLTGSMLGKTTVCTTQAERDAPAKVRQSIATQSNRCMTCQ